jgi:hypothetical protein
MSEHFVFLRSYRKVIELMFFSPLDRHLFDAPFEVVGVAENGMFKGIRKR